MHSQSFYSFSNFLGRLTHIIAPIELTHYEKLKKGFEETVTIMKSKGENVDMLVEIWQFDLMRLHEQVSKIRYYLANK